MPFITEKVNLSNEPAENWKSVDYYMNIVDIGDGESSVFSKAGQSFRSGLLASSLRNSAFGNKVLKSLMAATERPSENHTLHDVQINEFKHEIQCFLYVTGKRLAVLLPVLNNCHQSCSFIPCHFQF
jgi:hypothetical protein